MKYGFSAAIIFLLLALSVGFSVWKDSSSEFEIDETEKPSNIVRIGNNIVKVYILDTAPLRAMGLGGRDSISDDEGALFVFDLPRPYSFWMKDMRFPIDIIWIGEDRRVADITENLRPESYPAHYQPRYPAKYVLEVNAGWARRHSIQIGNTAILPEYLTAVRK